MILRFLLICLFLLHCKALINIKIPPITITNAQTAAEKQMVGEDRELEKEGWLISSIQSSATGNTTISRPVLEENDPALRAHLIRLNYLSNEVSRYKAHGIIGETPSGFLKWNPISQSIPTALPYENPARRKRAEDVIVFINESRKFVWDKELANEKKNGKKEEELQKWRANQIQIYYRSILPGEFYETVNGRWEKLQ